MTPNLYASFSFSPNFFVEVEFCGSWVLTHIWECILTSAWCTFRSGQELRFSFCLKFRGENHQSLSNFHWLYNPLCYLVIGTVLFNISLFLRWAVIIAYCDKVAYFNFKLRMLILYIYSFSFFLPRVLHQNRLLLSGLLGSLCCILDSL